MPEHFRALIVILFLASVVFLLRAARHRPDSERDYKRRRNLWFLLTLLAFVSHSFWLYAGAAAVILYLAGGASTTPWRCSTCCCS
jgi:apolipoprotein N-acyltransferase